jgi:hypothetical protein
LRCALIGRSSSTDTDWHLLQINYL